MLIGIPSGIAIQVIAIVLATRQVRAAATATEGFSYGRAFKAGFMVSVFVAVVSLATNSVFFGLINPNFNETMITWTKNLMEKSGAKEEQIEKMERDARARGTLVAQLRNGMIGAMVIGTLASLITAAVMKRDPSDEELDAPPVSS
jgi:hypothetical protein